MENENLNEKIKQHIQQLVKTAGLPDTEESVEALIKGWEEKFHSFETQVEERDMEQVEEFTADDERGALLMTYSGSLINLGPKGEDGRFVAYYSIGIRNDVPQSAETEGTDLAEDLLIDEGAVFTNGPIKKSSPVFKIAVIVEDLEQEEQEELLAEVTQVLTEDFIEVNKTLIEE